MKKSHIQGVERMYAQARKYVAPTMSAAMNAIKNDLGSEAVILHKKRLSDTLDRRNGYFEVIATVDDFRKNRMPASRAQERVKQLERELKGIRNAVSELVELYRMKSEKGSDQYSSLERKLIELGIDESLLSTLSVHLDRFDNAIPLEQRLEEIVSDYYRKKKEEKPQQQITIFLGPTGVGKTTTLAKISSKLKLDPEFDREIIYICLDYYRLGADEQLNKYAQILECKAFSVTTAEQLMRKLEEYPDAYIFIDTCGRSQLDEKGINDTFRILCDLGKKAFKYLVLSAVTRYEDMVEICNSYKRFNYDEVIFTKLDETTCVGNIFSLIIKTGMRMKYFTDGQDVPRDIRKIKSGSELVRMMFRKDAMEG